MKKSLFIFGLLTMVLSSCLKVDEFPEGYTIYEKAYSGDPYIFLHEVTTIVQPSQADYRRNYVSFRLDKSRFTNGFPPGAKLRLVTRIVDTGYYSHGNYNHYTINIPSGDEYIHSRQYDVVRPGGVFYFELSIVADGIELKRHVFSYTI